MDDSSDHDDSRAATPERPDGEERWRALFADLFDQFDQKTAAVVRLEAEKRELEEKLKKEEKSQPIECTSCKNKQPPPQQPMAYFIRDGQYYKAVQITQPATAGEPARITVPTAAVGTLKDTKNTPVVEHPKTAGNAAAAAQANQLYQVQQLQLMFQNDEAYFHLMGTGTPAAFAPLNSNQKQAAEKPKSSKKAAAATQAGGAPFLWDWPTSQASSFTHTTVRQPNGNFVAVPMKDDQKPAEKPKSPQKADVAPARPSTVSVQLKPAEQPPLAAVGESAPLGLYEEMRRLKADVQRLKEQRAEDVETLKLAFAAEVAELRSQLATERATRAWLEDEVRRLAVAARPTEPQEAAAQADEQPKAGPSGLAVQQPADEDDRESLATARSADSSADSWDKLEGYSQDDDELD
ncbi:hypothetical protein M3Y99_00810000 [Aphelenchoides fujianensis]|nr:hypothetical protein M3Y99_00810000 [Aphelenchoides fujianensis]